MLIEVVFTRAASYCRHMRVLATQIGFVIVRVRKPVKVTIDSQTIKVVGQVLIQSTVKMVNTETVFTWGFLFGRDGVHIFVFINK